MRINADEIRAETEIDEILNTVKCCFKSGKWPENIRQEIKPYYSKHSELTLEEDNILWGLRVIVPQRLRKCVLYELHNQHQGIVKMKALSIMHTWYPEIHKNIEELVKGCQNCQKVANEPAKSIIHPWSLPTRAMYRIFFALFRLS